MMRILGCVMIAGLVCAAPAAAVPVFTLLPSDGSVVAAPGETIGWGYEVTNDDPFNWLVIWNLGAGVFEHGTITDPLDLFDFPIVAPNSSVVVPYIAGDQGLYEFTWHLDAPAGFVNSGTFLISADLYDGDPILGGQFLSALPDFEAAYAVSTAAAPAAVPEPATLLLLSSGLGLAALCRRRKLV